MKSLLQYILSLSISFLWYGRNACELLCNTYNSATLVARKDFKKYVNKFFSFILCRISSFFCNENRRYLPNIDDCKETACCLYLAQNTTQILSILFFCALLSQSSTNLCSQSLLFFFIINTFYYQCVCCGRSFFLLVMFYILCCLIGASDLSPSPTRLAQIRFQHKGRTSQTVKRYRRHLLIPQSCKINIQMSPRKHALLI